MKKQRNPNANCGNCPYWHRTSEEDSEALWKGQCRIESPKVGDDAYWFPQTDTSTWCGEHPGFWAEEEAARTNHEEWFPVDYAPPKWETVICGNGKEIYAGFRSEAVWYRLGYNGTYPCAAPKRWKPLPEGCTDPGVLAMQALAETDGKEGEE